MKKILILLLSGFLIQSIQAQTDGLSYQALIIDNNAQEIPGIDISGNYLSEGDVALRFSIINNLELVEYQEVHFTRTDKFGMINLIIGTGEITGESGGLFNEIQWDGSPKQLEVELAYGESDFEAFSDQELLFLPFAYHRDITATGTLIVDGQTSLNSGLEVGGNTALNDGLDVLNGSPTNLSGNLTVEGEAFFNGNTTFNSILVEDISQLEGEVLIGGNSDTPSGLTVANEATSTFTGEVIVERDFTALSDANIAGTLSVTNGSPTNLSGNLTVQENLSTLGTSNFSDQVTINANLNGSQGSSSSYPLLVKGSTQGIEITVDGSGNNSKNFLTFKDQFGAVGAIEGQSFSDLQNSFEYDWELTLYIIDIAFMTAEGVACAAQLDFGEAGIISANLITYGIHYQAREDYIVENYGLYFKSGGADYAEYLEKADAGELFRKGDIVGVIGGKIRKQTSGADHIMVISSEPIVLGNAPDEGELGKYEKVAFLGQVPVRLVGEVEIGDYILPSGNDDGLGIAKSPEEMEVSEYKNILGVAWEESGEGMMSTVNVAIGLNRNDMASRLEAQEKEIASLNAKVDAILARLDGKGFESPRENSPNKTKPAVEKPFQMVLSPADFDAWYEEYGYIFEYYLNELQKHFESEGIDYRRHKEIVEIIDNPKQYLKSMGTGDGLSTLWQGFVQKYPEQFNR